MPTHSLLVTASGAALLFLAASSSAVFAHPSTATISTGSNPVRSAAGQIDLGATYSASSVITAPADHDLVLTDIILGIAVESDGVRCSGVLQLVSSDGTVLGEYSLRSGRVDNDNSTGASRQYAGSTGVRVPAGNSVSLNWDDTYRSHGMHYFNLIYTLSGYLAQP